MIQLVEELIVLFIGIIKGRKELGNDSFRRVHT